MHEEKYAQKVLVNSAPFQNQLITTAFPSWPACLSVDLDRNISQISLDLTVFFLFFFLWGWGGSASLSSLFVIERNVPMISLSQRRGFPVTFHTDLIAVD